MYCICIHLMYMVDNSLYYSVLMNLIEHGQQMEEDEYVSFVYLGVFMSQYVLE